LFGNQTKCLTLRVLWVTLFERQTKLTGAAFDPRKKCVGDITNSVLNEY
jgi:hypothetical protein